AGRVPAARPVVAGRRAFSPLALGRLRAVARVADRLDRFGLLFGARGVRRRCVLDRRRTFRREFARGDYDANVRLVAFAAWPILVDDSLGGGALEDGMRWGR